MSLPNLSLKLYFMKIYFQDRGYNILLVDLLAGFIVSYFIQRFLSFFSLFCKFTNFWKVDIEGRVANQKNRFFGFPIYRKNESHSKFIIRDCFFSVFLGCNRISNGLIKG